MEKLTGPKHNHLFTDLLKVAIFGLMLLLPFLCFLPTGFYYGFNEHATNEATTQINYKYQSNEVNTLDDLVEGNIYNFIIDYDSADSYITDNSNFNIELLYIYGYDFSNYNISLDETYLLSSVESSNIKVLFKINDGWAGYLDLYFNDESYIISNTFGDSLDSEIFYLSAVVKLNDKQGLTESNIFSNTDFNVIESVETNVQDTISNKMYLAWQGIWTSPLFNWTNNTPLNTGLNGFVSIFGINQSSYIANCLIYLLSITAIYVVFDIVLGIFKWLTHLINK